jgi:hypothetical protein
VGTKTLPFTGGGTGGLPFALFSMALGGALVVSTRRRKATRTHGA